MINTLPITQVKLFVTFLKERLIDDVSESYKAGYLEGLEDLSGLIIAQLEGEMERLAVEMYQEEFND